jgi:NAD(P)-dependent dehydrogenase (short-subunit alcohol dehydrogenase family)
LGLLVGKVAVHTATAGGQGRLASLAFTREGAKIVGCDLRRLDNEETVREVRAAGGERWGLAPVDLTDPNQVKAFVREAADRHGSIDIVYNNAGGPRFTKYAWPHLVARHGGVIINVASMAALIGAPRPPMAAHVAAKAGLAGLTRQLAVEGGPLGIRAVTISPGPIVTREDDLDDVTGEMISERTLLKRWGRPEEVVEVALFLASDRASYITGANIPIEGGATA